MKYKTQYINTINELKQQLDSLPIIDPNDKRRLKKKVRLEFNYNSNHLEGNTLTYGQTELLLLYDKSSGDVKVSDIEEMKAHDVALSQIEKMAEELERPLTESFIKELNQTILVRPFWKEAISPDGSPTRKKIEIGQYKTSPNHVRLRNGEIFEYAAPEETPAKMNDLMSWYLHNLDKMHPVQLAAEFHYRFVCIHPFDDGNGRVARLIMNYILLKNNYPPVIIKSSDKEAYLTALQKADIGDIEAIIEYVEKQILWSLDIYIKATNGEDIEERDDIDKEIELLKRERLTEEAIFKSPKVAFDIVHHIHYNIWMKLNDYLHKFDDFFTETSRDIEIDLNKLNNNSANLFYSYTKFKNALNNLGIDIENDGFSFIDWSRKLYSLKSAHKKTDFRISCNLHLKDKSYDISFHFHHYSSGQKKDNSTLLYNVEYKYNQYIMTEEINTLIRSVSKHLLNSIKNFDE